MLSPTTDDLVHPRDHLLRTMERIYRYRMTTTSGGNLSIRDDDGSIWITPARLDKGALRRDDIVRVKPNGETEGPHRASSEFPFHKAVYEARPDLRAIVHAHPVALVAFSICRRVPETRLLPVARRVCGRVGFASYALPGSETLGRNIAVAFAEGFDCVVLENHGVVIGGADLRQAFERFETLEFCAKTIIKAGLLGDVHYPGEADYDHPGPPSPLPYRVRELPPTSAEKELRRQLRDFVRRAYQQRLMISTQGAFSARLGRDAFLITPHRVDRSTLEIDDIVLIEDGTVETGKTPSTAVFPHREIYRSHDDVQAIVHAYPVNATAFAVNPTPLDSRTIPESYLFLRDVARAPFHERFGDGRALAARASLHQPVVLIENDGAQVCGTSVLDAYDRLEVLETTAEAMINSRPLGAMNPMSDAAIDELNQAFGLA